MINARQTDRQMDERQISKINPNAPKLPNYPKQQQSLNYLNSILYQPVYFYPVQKSGQKMGKKSKQVNKVKQYILVWME